MKKVYIIAAFLAILTSVLIYKFSINLEELSKPEDIQRISTVVAAKKIPFNTIITDEMIKVISIPKEAVVTGSCSTTAELIGRLTLAPFVPGEQLILSQTAAQGDKNVGRLSIELDADKYAMTLEVGTTSGIAGYIRVGDRINLVVLKPIEDQPDKNEAVIIARDIEVIRLGLSSSSGQDTYQCITMSVSEKQAIDIIYNSSIGSLRAILEPSFDKNTEKAS
ncbi:MAG: Flp pilus assembly protein CpaB [Oscillospiraceae bacterium]|nr:Flp pilus assembly protein CpaB [Oscillospiraceae bacterium]